MVPRILSLLRYSGILLALCVLVLSLSHLATPLIAFALAACVLVGAMIGVRFDSLRASYLGREPKKELSYGSGFAGGWLGAIPGIVVLHDHETVIRFCDSVLLILIFLYAVGKLTCFLGRCCESRNGWRGLPLAELAITLLIAIAFINSLEQERFSRVVTGVALISFGAVRSFSRYARAQTTSKILSRPDSAPGILAGALLAAVRF